MQTENLKMLKDLGNNSSLSTIQFEGDTAQKFLKNTADIQSGYTEIFKSLIQTYTTGAANQSFQNFLGSNTNYYTPTNYFQTYQQQNNATNLNAQMSLLAYQMQMGMQYNQNSNLYSSTNDLTNLFSMFG